MARRRERVTSGESYTKQRSSMFQTPSVNVRERMSVSEMKGESKERSEEPKVQKDLLREVEGREPKLVHMK